jgi:hypothetical protein
VSPQSVEVRTQLADGALGGPVVQVDMGDRSQVDFRAFDLTDGCPKDPALFACSSVRRQLDDGVAHVSNLGGRVWVARLGRAANRMDFVWV